MKYNLKMKVARLEPFNYNSEKTTLNYKQSLKILKYYQNKHKLLIYNLNQMKLAYLKDLLM